MNKLIVVGVIVAILGFGSVGASFYSLTQTEAYKETVPTEEEVIKTREVPVESQVPKTREVEKTKMVSATEKVPVWSDKKEEIKLQAQELGATMYNLLPIEIRTDSPIRVLVKNPIKSETNTRYYSVIFGFGSYEWSGWTIGYSTYQYRNYPTDSWGCYWNTEKIKATNEWECKGEKVKYDYKTNEFVFDPVLSDFPGFTGKVGRDKIKIKIYINVYEYKFGEWEQVYLANLPYNSLPYLEFYYASSYETKTVQKPVTTKETETYYVTETIMKQETYTEKVTANKEVEKTREISQKPYSILLWVGIGLLIVGAALIFFGSRSKAQVVRPAETKKTCPQCGKESPLESQFCTNCGTQLK